MIAEVESDVGRVESQEDEVVHLVRIDLDVSMLNDDEEDFLGACIDTGVSMLLVGREKAEAYRTMMNIPLVIEKRQNCTFRFGSQKKSSLEVSKFRIPYANSKMIELQLDVIEVIIPFLFGMDRLDEYKMYANNVEDILVRVDTKWTHPMTRKLGICSTNGQRK